MFVENEVNMTVDKMIEELLKIKAEYGGDLVVEAFDYSVDGDDWDEVYAPVTRISSWKVGAYIKTESRRL